MDFLAVAQNDDAVGAISGVPLVVASDSNPGTLTQPWMTIEHAANTATAGTFGSVMNRLLAVESIFSGEAGWSKGLLWMFLVSSVVEGVKLVTVPSVLVVMAEPAVELRVCARGFIPNAAWVSRVSPAASKTFARPGLPAPALVMTTVKLCGCGAGPVTATGVTTGR